MPKYYNVVLSNYQCAFDARDGIATEAEVIDFIRGRGGSYGVYVDAGRGTEGEWVQATYYDDKDVFLVDLNYWGQTSYLSPAQYADYIRKNL